MNYFSYKTMPELQKLHEKLIVVGKNSSREVYENSVVFVANCSWRIYE